MPSVINRATIEAYLAHLAAHGPTPNTRLGYLTGLRGFPGDGTPPGMALALPADAVIYGDDLPRRPAGLPRFIAEEVMAQLESDTALAALPDATTRHLVIVLMETGLRAGDACRLDLDCLVADSVGWPCLRFINTKVAAEQLVPLSARAAEAVRAQQAEVAQVLAGLAVAVPRHRRQPRRGTAVHLQRSAPAPRPLAGQRSTFATAPVAQSG